MRNLLINLLAPALLLAATTIVSGQSSQQPKSGKAEQPPPAKPKDTPAKSKLEQMLELALKNNPDIRVADAKAREADAEVNRTRLAVTQKVVGLYNDIEAARANVQVAEQQLARLANLNKSNLVSREEIYAAEAKLVQTKATLSKLEAEIPYLLGQQNLKGNLEAILSEVEKAHAEDTKAAIDKGLLYLWQVERARTDWDKSATTQALRAILEASPPAVNNPMSEKIRAKLDLTITYEHREKWTPADTLEFLAQRYDLPLRNKDPEAKFMGADLSVRFETVSIGGLLQWMEDSLPDHRFVVRDYGIVLMKRDKIPPGAMLLDDFRKSKAKDTPKPKEEKK